MLALAATLDEEDRVTYCFDPAVIDWDHYAFEVHLPSVVEHARVRTKAGKSVVEKRPERARKAILSPDRHLAVFDLEHTLMASNVVDTYAWLASRHLPAARRARFVAELVRSAPGLLALDRRDRGDFLRSFYRRYDGAPVARLHADSWELFHRQLLPRCFPAGLARVRAHRRLGHRTLLITGALDFVVEPLRPLFDDIVCARLDQARRQGSPAALRSCRRSARPVRCCSPTTPRHTTSRSRSRWPTPTPRATWRCSRRSGSPSRSIPNRAWRRSPVAEAGTSSTGPRPAGRLAPAAPARPPRRPLATAARAIGPLTRPAR